MIDVKDLQHVIDHVDLLPLKNKRIFVTGGSGFIGKWMLESILYANDKLGLNCEVVALTRNVDRVYQKYSHLTKSQKLQWKLGDVRDFKIYGGGFDYVLHFASDEGHRLTVSDPLQMVDIIVNGAWNILEFAKMWNSKFLFLSSGIVNSKEDNVYVKGKRMAEDLCSVYHDEHGLDVKIARGYCFVGAYLPLDKHFAIGNFIGDALNHRPVTVNSDGMAIRSYLYMADVVVWLWIILLKGKACVPYEVGSNRILTIGKLARKVSEFGNHKVVIKELKGTYDAYYPELELTKSLGLRQHIGLSESIERTIEWYRRNKCLV